MPTFSFPESSQNLFTLENGKELDGWSEHCRAQSCGHTLNCSMKLPQMVQVLVCVARSSHILLNIPGQKLALALDCKRLFTLLYLPCGSFQLSDTQEGADPISRKQQVHTAGQRVRQQGSGKFMMSSQSRADICVGQAHGRQQRCSQSQRMMWFLQENRSRWERLCLSYNLCVPEARGLDWDCLGDRLRGAEYSLGGGQLQMRLEG